MPPGSRTAILSIANWYSATSGGLNAELLGEALVDLLPFLAVFLLGTRGRTKRWAVVTGPGCADAHWQQAIDIIPASAQLVEDGQVDNDLDYMIFEEPVDGHR